VTTSATSARARICTVMLSRVHSEHVRVICGLAAEAKRT
jgi:hypothetical protein